MTTMCWALRHTGRPFGPCEKLEPDDFKFLVSNHTTLSAARKRERQERADMRRVCGPNAWDNHYYVFPLKPTQMRVEAECPTCGRTHMVRYVWQPGEFDPGNDLWISKCPRCAQGEVANAS